MTVVVAVVGLGNMGLGMAGSLLRAGFRVTGSDVDAGRQEAARAAGVAVGTLAEVLGGADAVILSLPLAQHVAAVIEGGGLLDRRDGRVIVVDTSTSEPDVSRRLDGLLQAAGHGFLDAPVSGGPSGAAAGTLTMMLGGAPGDVAQAQPVLAAMASIVLHVGPSGAGNVAKLVNNLLVAAHLAIAGEAMRLSEAAGLGATEVLRVVNAATGRSVATETMLPKWVLPETFDSGFSAGLMRKDVRLAVEMAERMGLALPLAGAVRAAWQTDGLADTDDFTAIAALRR